MVRLNFQFSYANLTLSVFHYKCNTFLPRVYHSSTKKTEPQIQNTAYSGTDLIPFSRPKFFLEMRREDEA